MVFSSLEFLFIFLPMVLVLYFLVQKKYRNILLLIANIVFYAYGGGKFIYILLLSCIVNWLGALLIEKFKESKSTKVILIVALILDVGILFVYKYLNFGISIIDQVFHISLPMKEIVLPIGISFYTFQIISYIVDVYRQEVPAQKNPLYVIMYIMLFPQLIAGPIVRYETIAAEITEREVTISDIEIGVKRFIQGFGKKVILANGLSGLVDITLGQDVARGVDSLSVVMAWMGMLAYTLQIYYDFSGYSDMAIGLGRILGFHFEENFNYPYWSKSITDFWRRWHISLSSWFRDYIYIPLGGGVCA